MIDHQGRPNPGPHDCSPTSIVLNSETLELEYRFDYYVYGQFMKFIRPGAVRVHSDTRAKSLPNVAVQNADGSVVLVAVNLARSATEFAVEWNGTYLTTRLDARSLATFRWTP